MHEAELLHRIGWQLRRANLAGALEHELHRSPAADAAAGAQALGVLCEYWDELRTRGHARVASAIVRHVAGAPPPARPVTTTRRCAPSSPRSRRSSTATPSWTRGARGCFVPAARHARAPHATRCDTCTPASAWRSGASSHEGGVRRRAWSRS